MSATDIDGTGKQHFDLSRVVADGPARDVALIEVGGESIRTFTYEALDALISAVARGFRRRFAGKPFRVAVLARNSAEFVALYFGVVRAGGVIVPFNWRAGAQGVAYMLADAQIDLIFTDDPDRRVEGAPLLRFRSPEWDTLLDPGQLPPRPVGDDEVAEILYTSGSTGQPKGVPLTHAGQYWAVRTAAALVPEGQSYRVLVAAPLFHMNALFNLTRTFFSGGAVVLLPGFSPAAFAETIVTYRCDWVTGVPPMVAMLARHLGSHVPREFGGVRQVFIGSAPYGDALFAEVRRLFPTASIFNAYGTTEAGPTVFGPHPLGLPVPPLSCGYPLASHIVRLVDDRGCVVTGEGEGSLSMRTPALMAGYLNRPEITAQVIEDGWYDSRDVMRRDADGFFYFVGRTDDMFNSGGENIYPAEVEGVLEQHPSIEQAVVVLLADEIKYNVPVAFVVPREGAAIREDEIKAWFINRAAPYLHPRRVFPVAEIPLGQTNKIDRSLLKRVAQERAETDRDNT